MLDNSAPSGNERSGARNHHGGKTVTVIAVIGLLLISLFVYFVVPTFVNPYLEKRPAELASTFQTLGDALRAYSVDHEGQFPPMEPIVLYRRANKNILKSRAEGITTYRVPALTTPVAYVDIHAVGDPYAMPEQFAPPGYFVGEYPESGVRVAVLFSPGPNLVYDIRNVELKDKTTYAELKSALKADEHDPAKGLKSGGDVFTIVEIPIDTPG